MPLQLSFSIDGSTTETIKDGTTELIKKIKPDWDISKLNFKVYSDGITNQLMGVWLNDFEDQILIRIYGKNTEQFIDRNAEKENMMLLHKHSCASPLYATFENGLCYGFIPGTPLSTNCVYVEKKWKSVAKRMAKFHQIKNDENLKPTLLLTIRKLCDLIPETLNDPKHQKRLESHGYCKEYYLKQINNLEQMISKLDAPVVLCHNDILLANIIWNEKNGSVNFIDYEYSAPNYQAYDIANHFNEFAGVEEVDYNLYPSDEYQMNWIRSYLAAYKNVPEEKVSEEEIQVLKKHVSIFGLGSHLLWGIWAVVQSIYSSIDFDFVGYAIIRLDELKKRKEQLNQNL